MGTSAWRIDWDKRIIYLSHDISNADLVALYNKLYEDERGLQQGAAERWTLITVGQDN